MKIVIVVIVIIIIIVIAMALKGPAEPIPKNAFFVDVRTPGEFQMGSVANAVNIPLSQISHNLDRFENKESIVVFCRSGARSGNAKKILSSNGFDNVINGGSWQNVSKSIAYSE